MTFEQEPAQEQKESVEAKKERLRPVFEQSVEVVRNPKRPLRDGALTVTREKDGKIETLHGLVILVVLVDAVDMASIAEDGDVGPSEYMDWEEIVDATKE